MTVILFNGWVKHDLILKLPNNSVVVMNNASFHKSPYLKTMLEKEGQRIINKLLEHLPSGPYYNYYEPGGGAFQVKHLFKQCFFLILILI
ncbi:hypothetical protein OCHUTO_0987 [Orientia chuto str. Dubai]|uniref:DDE superendonuclease family protein n=1 Tax=Orientia chuto str. Dubai TaxID=1359168 RepID=A0A0F3MHI4_9RICK|nr:hypothetical protein OCHUTO_0987 [Orientia chuto str. Dubai]